MDNRVEVILFRKNKKYKLVPEINDDCTGCALNGNCNNVPKFKQCYNICAHLSGVWKEIEDETASVDALRSKIYKVASSIRALTASAMARERGISCAEVRGIAAKLETIADEGGVS